MYSEDMADACLHLMRLPDTEFVTLLGNTQIDRHEFEPPLINIGTGTDVSIADLSAMISETVGYGGRIEFDTSKPDGTPRKLMDITRLSAAGFQPAVTLRDGLKRAYLDYTRTIGALAD